ncbi:CAP family protein [Saccharothrix sp. Mg75]|uniref:CAP family protein n=1 Tax=Saccharothrix sp. Mg75 TaxID=3445357 RepID=UPI003EE837ED
MGSRAAFPDHTDQEFLDGIVQSINDYRAKHGAAPVQLDPELVEYAKSRAALVSTENYLNHGHAGLRTGLGENLSWQASSAPGVAATTGATGSWYGEIKDYDFALPAPADSSKTGHFTQLVWKDSARVGAGRAYGKGGDWYETYIALVFSPAGNMEGAYQANVSPTA